MSIKEILEKIKSFYFLFLVLVIAGIFFALGRLSMIEERHIPIQIKYSNESQTGTAINGVLSETITSSSTLLSNSAEVIGSKNSKKYYFPWCGTIKRVKPENQVHFASADLARVAGYTAGGNCKGLK